MRSTTVFLSAVGALVSLGQGAGAAPSSAAALASSSTARERALPLRKRRASTCKAPKKAAAAEPCEFDAAARPECWGAYSLATNWYETTPETGVVREYWWELVNGTARVDGVERVVLTVNGSFPGPTIFADWGDEVVVHVTNKLAANGTSIHWHGLHQRSAAQQDGVASITQCPLAPGGSTTYRWRATQYGHTWYHSHFALQAWNGVLGGIVVRGPASAPYDDDQGVLFLNDWYHQTTDELWPLAAAGIPPGADNGLINGTNVSGDGAGGRRFETVFTPGRRHRLRLVNAALDTHFKFSVDGHRLTVMAADLVPVVPYETDVLSIAIGQRYDVVIAADAGPDAGPDFWMRASPDTACSAQNPMADNVRGIVRYDAASRADPATAAHAFVHDCLDEPLDRLVPVVPVDVAGPATTETFDIGAALSDATGLFQWTVNNQSFLSDWSAPTLLQAVTDDSVFAAAENVVALSEQESMVYFVIKSEIELPHPIHLHGHDFFVLAQAADAVFDANVTLKLENPIRRDVAMLPAAGYLVLGFVTDNPGVWLLHCHIGWHTSQGFALQLVERMSEIPATVDVDAAQGNCDAWQAYADAVALVQEDSGV